MQPPKATTKDVTPATLTVTRTGPRGRTPPSAPQEALTGKASLTPSQSSTRRPGQHPQDSQGPRQEAAEPRKGGRLTLLLSWPCDCNPRSQVKSPSSKNSHPSSVPTQQPGRAQGQAGLGTQPRGSSWDEADRRPPLEGQPGLLTPPLCWRGASPSLKTQTGTSEQAPACPPAVPGPGDPAHLDGRSLPAEHCPGASGDRRAEEAPEASFWLTWPGEAKTSTNALTPGRKRTWDPDFSVSARVPGKGGK